METDTSEQDAHSNAIRTSYELPLASTPLRIMQNAALNRMDLLDVFVDAPGVDESEVDDRVNSLLGCRHLSESNQNSAKDSRSIRFMLDPHSKARVAHDLFSILVLALDVISAPVILAWNIEVTGFLNVLNFVSLSFWSLDIIMSFITGFYIQGVFEARPMKVAKRYVKSWFFSDIFIVLADLTTLCLARTTDSSRGNGSGVLRVSKASRFLRLVRLFRLARVSDAFARIVEANAYLEITMETVKPFCAIIVINHLLACAWWSISFFVESDTNLKWIYEKVSSGADLQYQETPMIYQYLTCVHWSLTQVTPGSMEVVPRNSFERGFNCFSLLLGMIIFSSLISSISAKMMQHYLKQKDKLTKLSALRRFLGGKVAPHMVIAATFQANKALFGNNGKPSTVNDIAAVALLPQALQRHLQVELCAKHLQHPLLRWWFVIDLQGAQLLCYTAVEFIGLAAEDNLFFSRTQARGAYIMTHGTGKYVTNGETFAERAVQEVDKGSFFCEAALWCKWTHVGELKAITGCELILIRTNGLIACLDQDVMVKYVVVQYGISFYARLMAPPLLGSEMQKPNDVSVAFTEFDSILPSLPAECRQLIGAVALHVARQKPGHKDLTDATAAEVRQGRCCLMVNWEGEVERIVSIIVLRLSRQDGRVLVQLGKWTEDAIQASCELPGKKQKEGETPTQAFARIFQGAYAPFLHTFQCTGAELEVAWKESKRVQLKTKYLRSVNNAELTCPVDVLVHEVGQITVPRKRGRRSLVGSASSMTSETPAQDDNDSISVYALADDQGGITFVGWLHSEDHKVFTATGGEAVLQGAMDDVVLTPDMVEFAKERYAACHGNPEEVEICFERTRLAT